MTDPGWLVDGDPEQVLEVLDGAAGREEVSAAAVYRTSGHVHRDAVPEVRRQVLALDAARYGDRTLARGIAEAAVGQQTGDRWVVQWATGSGLDSRLRFAMRAPSEVRAVATVVAQGRGLAVVGCKDGTLHWWDLATGRKLGAALTEHGMAGGIATAVLDGRPVAVTGGSDGTVRVWDLTESETVAAFHAEDDSPVYSITAGLVEGRPVVFGRGTNGVVRAWDLTALPQPGARSTIHTGAVCALATLVLGDRFIVVTGHPDRTARAWDLITGREIGTLGDRSEGPDVVTGHSDGERPRCGTSDLYSMTNVVATDPTSECPMALCGGEYGLRVWNLATGEQIIGPVPVGFVSTAAVTVLRGRPAALVARSRHGAVEVWDLPTLRPLCPPLTGHEATVCAAATALVKGRHLAVTAGDDRSVRIWDLDVDTKTGSRTTGHAEPVREFALAVVEGRSVIVAAGPDGNVRILDLDGGGQVGDPLTGLTGLTGAVVLLSAGVVEGRPTLITRERNEVVRIWDLVNREELPGRSTSAYSSPSIWFFAALEDRFVAVTWEGRVWDLAASRWIGVRPRQSGALALETLGGRNVILTGRGTETVHLWDMATGDPMGPPMTGHGVEVRAGAAGMLDGRLAVAAGGSDGIVRVWDAGAGQQIGEYAFPAGIWRLAVTPDGRVVVGFGSDIAVLTHG